jgi:hypothetical protein
MSWKAEDMNEGFVEFKKGEITFEVNAKEENSYNGETIAKVKGKFILDDKIKFDEINTKNAIDKNYEELPKIVKEARKDHKGDNNLIDYLMESQDDTIERSKLAVFINNFSQYYDRVTMDGLNLKQRLGMRNENVNDAQLNYMVANGLTTQFGNPEVENMKLPEGYILPKVIKEIFNVSEKDVVAYTINDNFITSYENGRSTEDGSASHEFYGDDNGKEYHYFTSDGHVFTLPGYAHKLSDGTIKYYISNEKGCWYLAVGTSPLEIGSTNIEGEIITTSGPITHEDLVACGTNKIPNTK